MKSHNCVLKKNALTAAIACALVPGYKNYLDRGGNFF